MYKRKAGKKVKEDPIQDFANYLKNSRLLMNISFEELVRYSRINKSHLRGIEDGDIDEYLNKTYARGFIKAYADCIGLDIDDTLSRYNYALQKYYEQNKMNILKRYKKHIFYGFIILLLIVTALIYFKPPHLFFTVSEEYVKGHEDTGLIEESQDRDGLNGDIEPWHTEEHSLVICAKNTVVISITDENGIVSEEVMMKGRCKTIYFTEYIVFSISDISNVSVEHNSIDITGSLREESDSNVLINYRLKN